jgi:F0F1-type ATP synthase membrane subunit b/b'
MTPICFVLTLLVTQTAGAAEPVSPARKLWDTIMMFVNFGILVFLFLRYGKEPLMDYLRGIREKISNELGTVQDRLHQTQTARDAEATRLETIDQHIQEIQANVLNMAKREKERIIEEGRRAADKMIQDAEKYSRYKLLAAKKAVRDQMVDIAITMAEDRLARKMTEDDNQRFVEHFIRNLAAAPQTKKQE